ncbi:MAG: HD domain-containing protein [Chloroflexi bacterium]|nr:HD domain-containing protein [Chloroflexota bacterium]
MNQRARYLHEVGMLNLTPRSGLAFLGSGAQSVSEHTLRMLHVAFVLARMSDQPIDELQLLHLVMFHDLPEARTGDHNYVNRKYVHEDLDQLLADGAREWAHGDELVAYIREFEDAQTPAARLAKDADQLELLLVLKREADLGNPHVADWVTPLLARLKTDAGKQLAQEILATRWDEWWFNNKDDPHWVHGKASQSSAQHPKRRRQKIKP